MATTNLGLTLPTVGASDDTWGTSLNADLDIIDRLGTKPTVQKLTSGTGATYTPPTNCRLIRVTIKGGGGGSNSTGTTTTQGGTGGTSSFNSVTAIGGTGAIGYGPTVAGGTGGSDNSLTVVRRPGAPSTRALFRATADSVGNYYGGAGGGAGGGVGSDSGQGGAGVANSGGGGGGSRAAQSNQAFVGSNALATYYEGSGGAEGETAIVWLPATTYTYTVGAGGTGPSAGTSGYAGAAGGSGVIIVEEFY